MAGSACSFNPLVSTGIAGLDDILGGGITPDRLYLVEGNPGSGKTTLAMQFLLEGVQCNETGIYVTLSETKIELIGVAKSHGWSLDRIHIVELSVPEDELQLDNQYTLFQPSELELGITTKAILQEIERLKPTRVVIDSLSEIRLLAQSPLRYRRQILALKQFFIGRSCTVLLTDDRTSEVQDLQLQSLAHGVITLEHTQPTYGVERRRLLITKMRGQKYRGGYHDFIISTGGLKVFPRLAAQEHRQKAQRGKIRSKIEELNTLLGGGVEIGSSMLLVGPAGSGKSSIAMQYAWAVVSQGERAIIFSFDERLDITLQRAEGMGLNLIPFLESGKLVIQPVDPAELSPGEFTNTIQSFVEGQDGQSGARLVVIDSLNGYLHAMPEERFLTAQLHELLMYLGHKGVVTVLVLAQHGIIDHYESPVDATYLADTVVLFRYMRRQGELHQVLSVIKKRSGKHERTFRELRFEEGKIQIGEPFEEPDGL